MVIGIDARFCVHKRRGIGNYTINLINHLSKIDAYNNYILYVDRDDIDNVLPKQKNFYIKKLLPSNYFIWEQFLLPLQAKRDGVNILHCTGNTAPIYLNKQIKLVSSIMDVMYLKDYSVLPLSPSLYQRLGRLYRKIVVPKAVKIASKVITISNFCKQDIIGHLPFIREDDIVVTHLSADDIFCVIGRNMEKAVLSEKFGITGDYILSLGGIDPRKNTELVIRAFMELKNGAKVKGKLVIVGVPNWVKSKFHRKVQDPLHKEDIVFTGFVSNEDLVVLYNCATVFLYPSLYEGFGLPVLEAMACGCPVIASKTSSIPEIADAAALLINPNKEQELKESLIRLLNNKKLRNEFIRMGYEQVKKFSWHNTAKKTLEIYKRVYAGERS